MKTIKVGELVQINPDEFGDDIVKSCGLGLCLRRYLDPSPWCGSSLFRCEVYWFTRKIRRDHGERLLSAK